MFQQNHTSHGHSPLNHFKPSMKRAAFQKRMGPLLLGAMVWMIIGAVTLHVGGPIFLFQTGFGAFSLNNPISSVLIAVSFVFALFKLKSDRPPIGIMPIGRHPLRSVTNHLDGRLEKALGGIQIPLFTKARANEVPIPMDGTIQVAPFPDIVSLSRICYELYGQ